MPRRYLLAALAVIAISGAVWAAVWSGHVAAGDGLRRSVADTNVLIVVLDAMRADHVGCYGYARETTPNIDRLAEESLTFAEHYCPMPFTTPSTASLFTGQHPDTHWVIYPGWEHDEPEVTLASTFAAAGWRTALFSSTPCAAPVMGVGTRFEEAWYRQRDLTEGPGFGPEALVLRFEEWLRQRRGERWLAYLHFVPPHAPYEQPDHMTALFADREPPGYAPGSCSPWVFPAPIYPTPEDRPGLEEPPPLPDWINLYDANLRYGDWALGEVLGLLERDHLLDQTLVVVTSDHGEAFGEHGFIWHPHGAHREVSHIPLVIRFPGGLVHDSIVSPTRTVDVFPTLCHLYGLPVPAGAQGVSLLPVMSGSADSGSAAVVTESFQPRKYMIRTPDSSLLVYEDRAWWELYDGKDRAERRNIIAERPAEARELFAALRRWAVTQDRPAPWLASGSEAAPAAQWQTDAMSDDLRRDLEALGYLR